MFYVIAVKVSFVSVHTISTRMWYHTLLHEYDDGIHIMASHARSHGNSRARHMAT